MYSESPRRIFDTIEEGIGGPSTKLFLIARNLYKIGSDGTLHRYVLEYE